VAEHSIHVLPETIANKIAAGEVVLRPESVVKELLENCLDAGAQSIVVQVKEGGVSLIQVSDDGAGMDEEDAVMAFQRHATSKIVAYEDLEAIRTFGFRGEALASIAAVAQVSLTTRRREEDTAVVVKIDGGGKPQKTRGAREPGTTISVQNLFYNVPARRKFLKSTTTEFRHVYDAVHRVAISYPEIGLDFFSDGQAIFRLKPSSLPQRLAEVFGERTLEGLLPVEERSQNIRVHGYIGKPAFGQNSRTNQYLFLNRRFVVHRNVSHAVFSSYEHLLAKGTFPFFLLFVEIDPSQVDVNIHPSKMEAKFEDEPGMYRFVSALVRKALSGGDAIPSLSILDSVPGDQSSKLQFGSRQHQWPGPAQGDQWSFPEREQVDSRTGEIVPLAGGMETARRLLSAIEGGNFPPGTAAPSGGELKPEDRPLEGPVWQLHTKYIIAPVRGGVVIVDQHVAHERVLYENILRRFGGAKGGSQQLLFPKTMQISAADFALVEELHGDLEQLGFDLKFFGKNTLVLEGVPSDVRKGQEETILQETLELFKQYRSDSPAGVRDTLAKSFSCRSAVKAGDPLTEGEMRALLEQLSHATMPYVCPHGRPVMLRISIDELDRRFGRL
jgi:DNA mismatch repair protein MutL